MVLWPTTIGLGRIAVRPCKMRLPWKAFLAAAVLFTVPMNMWAAESAQVAPIELVHILPFALFGIAALLLAIWFVWQRTLEKRELEKQLALVSELESEYRDLFDNASDLVYTHDMEGRFLTVNRAFAEAFGYSREELIGRVGFEFLTAESRVTSRAMLDRKLKDGQPTRYEADYLTKDGRKLHLELVTRLMFREGKPIGVHGVARDITERQQIEFRKRVFLEMGHKLSHASTYEGAAEAVLEAAQQFIGFDSCLVYAISEDQQHRRILIQTDLIDGVAKRFPEEDAYKPLPPLTHRVVKEGSVLVLRKAEEMVEPRDQTEMFGSKRRSASIAIVPIRLPGRVLGVLGVHSYSFNAYNENTLKTLEGLADYCVGAFERIRVREEMITTLKDLEHRVQSRTAELSALNESLRHEVVERKRIEAALREAHAGLELRVSERTEELSRINAQLRKEIGGHRQTSAALQQSEQRLRALIEASPVGIALSRNGIILYANKAHMDMFGYTEQWQLKGRFFIDLVALQCREEVRARVRRRIEQKLDRDSYETVGLRRDGSQFFYQVEAASMQLEDGPATLAFLIDTTRRHDAEQALRQSEERFSRAFHALPIPVSISTYGEGRIIDANEAFLRLFEHQREQIIGQMVNDIGLWYDPQDRVALIKDMQNGMDIRGRECRYRTRSGRLVMTSVYVERVELQGRPCLIFITQDQTERINLETQLRHSQKMEAIGQLAAGVAHDFNNIMTIIQGHASLLEREMVMGTDAAESVNEIITASERAATLTRQLLTFSRKQIIQLKAVELNELIRNFSRMLNRLLGEHVALDLHFEPGLPAVKADAGMVEQIIMNLVVNARDAMTNGGQVTISTRPITVEAGSPRGQHAGKYVCLTIADNGSGMDPDTMSRIFEPFFTTKEVGKGSGLGLATVYGIVEQHSGWIEVESALGKGTVFRVYLPVAADVSQAAVNMEQGTLRNAGNGTVLVAEDEASVLGLVTAILNRGGYQVIAASSGDDALLLWEQHADEIDLLLTDMVMPGMLSGKGLAERIHEQKPSLPVIYSSGYSLEIVREGLVLKEGVNFLPKPYPPATLLKMVRECLAQGRQQGGADTRAI